ncbi:MAG: clan AA aspartic protease [Planctomycetota bacterium]|nr:clan AA aspartic protease [Planctomycetota bacterium]
MITGEVTADREAIIRLVVRSPSDGELEIDAIADTGFDGWLSLPPSLISRLGLPWRQRGRALLADGSESIFDIYEGIVVWDGHARRVTLDEADTAPLVGMSLLGGYELTIQVRTGGSVAIARLP